MRKVMGFGLAAVLLLAACEEADRAVQENEQSDELVISRDVEDPPSVAAYLPKFDETEIPELEPEVLMTLTEEKELAEALTQDEMYADFEIFIRTMRYGYGPYEFYGGDEAFKAAAEEMNQWISSSEGQVSGEEYARKLRDAFSFIKDQHFFIQGVHAFMKEMVPYGVESWQFTKENDDYFFNDEKIVLINGEHPELFIEPSFSEDGELIYQAITMADSSGGEWTLETESDTYKSTPVQFFTNPESLEPFEISETEDGIPVVRFGTMMVNEKDEFTYDDMFEAGELIKESPEAILDLRDNNGGNGNFVEKFIHNLTGSPPSKQEYLLIGTNTQHVLLSNVRDLYEEAGFNIETFYDHMPPILYGLHSTDAIPVEPVSKVVTFGTSWAGTGVEIDKEPSLDTKLYILMNKNTVSAAEWMTEALMEYENVVLIGTPTAGAFTSDAGAPFYLPNSGVLINMPSTYSISPYSYQREAIGIEPDVWIHGTGALERTIKWAEREG
ncbi:S41 family peptidase [Jeotgalibacillus sp. R-1-5s-1]|uniref:S41 family peptidase n=1 Tax=Jeotgalibacillus sp. R-1-5s-1 TaxID=2555897 RepID=UPI00106D717E|nr:S41 family peptidase [Jeotgalibacillus sp. R-1-5s-1]TFD93626.1 hypothetical protein E2491_14390 [Jeotgalibacillus sp. R-1-5s-1]